MTSPKNKKYPLLVDTCVISSFGNPYIVKPLAKALERYKEINIFCISYITFFELLDGIPENKFDMMYGLTIGFKKYDVTDKVLFMASHLGAFYKNLGIHPAQISMADKIIAATSILTGSMIFTADIEDFPTELFREVERIPIRYENKKGKSCSILYYLITPDYDSFDFHFNSRVSKLQVIRKSNSHNNPRPS